MIKFQLVYKTILTTLFRHGEQSIELCLGIWCNMSFILFTALVDEENNDNPVILLLIIVFTCFWDVKLRVKLPSFSMTKLYI